MALSQRYLDAIKKSEGFTPRATWDYKQNSNGYGTRARAPGEVIDQPEAERRLLGEITAAKAIVDRFAPNADEGTKAALTSLTFNAGDGWTRAGLGRAIQAGDLDTARSLFLQYNKAGGQELPGLVSRRQGEATWIGNENPSQNVAGGQSLSPPSSPQGSPERPPATLLQASAQGNPQMDPLTMLIGKLFGGGSGGAPGADATGATPGVPAAGGMGGGMDRGQMQDAMAKQAMQGGMQQQAPNLLGGMQRGPVDLNRLRQVIAQRSRAELGI